MDYISTDFDVESLRSGPVARRSLKLTLTAS